jgi:hypothetical protein
MSSHRNSNYYSERALEERRMMEAAIDPRSVSAHAELAARYEALAAYPSLDMPAQRSASG